MGNNKMSSRNNRKGLISNNNPPIQQESLITNFKDQKNLINGK